MRFCAANAACWSCLAFDLLALVGGALYLQFVSHEDPCPLCIIQRYFFLLIAFSRSSAPGCNGWRGVRLLEALVALSALGGIVTAARHVYVQARPGLQLRLRRACSRSSTICRPRSWLPQVFKVAGLCETPYPPILGLSLPQWSLVAFVVVFLALARAW